MFYDDDEDDDEEEEEWNNYKSPPNNDLIRKPATLLQYTPFIVNIGVMMCCVFMLDTMLQLHQTCWWF